jgi:hypothetical protein
MITRSWWWLSGLVLTAMAAGCSRTVSTPASTGAEAVARSYFEALLQKDWPGAFGTLHPDSRQRYSTEEFARLAESYRKSIGFEPTELRVRSCEEHGSEALAHVVLAGRVANKQRTHRDAIVLRKTESEWAVILPPQFGQTR